MALIHFGNVAGQLAEAVTETYAYLGRRGSGKSYGAMELAEQFAAAKAQIVAIDPVGVWWSLRVAADGKSDGFDIPIFGGLRGDIPLEPTAGKLVADLVVDRGISVILDVSLFSKADRKRFVTDFAAQLFMRKKRDKSPLHLFLEESHIFVPEQFSSSDAAMLGAFEDIIRLGRNFGIGATLISQRPQSINKEVLNQTEVLVVLQTSGPQEREAIRKWIVYHGIGSKDLVDQLPSLHVGEAFFWSPSWLRVLEKVKINPRKTFDASATPRLGKTKIAEPRPLSPDELTKVAAEMAETIERAKANDPKALRAEIASLRAKLASVKPEVEYVEVRVPVIPDAVKALRHCISAFAVNILEFEKKLIEACKETPTVQKQVTDSNHTRAASFRPTKLPLAPNARKNTVPGADTCTHKLSKAERLILTALAQHPAGCNRRRLALLSGYSANGGAFRNTVSSLNTKDYIEKAGDEVRITNGGCEALGPFDPLPTGEALLAYWLNELGDGAPSKSLRVIAQAYPSSIPRKDVAERAGYEVEGGAFRNGLSRLRTLQLIEGSKDLRASEELFA